MSGETSTASHLSVAMTTAEDDITQTTGVDGVTSSSSRGVALYFECAVLIIGVVGTAANGLVLYALVASRQHKKHELIVNQNALDLYSCVFLIISYGMKLFKIDLTGSLGYWLCVFLLSENLLWCGICGSYANLTLIAIERYLKVVHAAWSKKHLRKWMIYAAIAFAWISSFVRNMAVAFESSAVINGACMGYTVWKNPVSQLAYSIFYFLSAYVLVLMIFIFCYGRILIAVRHQVRVMASHDSAGLSAGQTQTSRPKIQSSATKTMILVCAFYAVAWLPDNMLYFLLMVMNLQLSFVDAVYYLFLFIAFLYICVKITVITVKRCLTVIVNHNVLDIVELE